MNKVEFFGYPKNYKIRMFLKFKIGLFFVELLKITFVSSYSINDFNVCGKRPIQQATAKIIGGQNALEGDWGWQVSIYIRNSLIG